MKSSSRRFARRITLVLGTTDTDIPAYDLSPVSKILVHDIRQMLLDSSEVHTANVRKLSGRDRFVLLCFLTNAFYELSFVVVQGSSPHKLQYAVDKLNVAMFISEEKWRSQNKTNIKSIPFWIDIFSTDLTGHGTARTSPHVLRLYAPSCGGSWRNPRGHEQFEALSARDRDEARRTVKGGEKVCQEECRN